MNDSTRSVRVESNKISISNETNMGVDGAGSAGTKRKSPDMVHRNGYTYITQKTLEGTRYLKCNMRSVTQCTATAKISIGGSLESFVDINHDHNHGPSNSVEKKAEFTETLRRLVCSTQEHHSNLKSIYRSAADKDPVGAAEVPFRLAVQSMRNWRKQNTLDAHQNLISDYRRCQKATVGKTGKYGASRKESDIIFKDGFAYVFQQIGRNPPVRYLKCRMKRLTNCTATGKVPLDVEGTSAADFVQIKAEHNHPPEVDTERRTKFVKILKAMCTDVANRLMAVKKIYEAAVIRYPEGVGVVPFKTVQSSMFKWKTKASKDVICKEEVMESSVNDNIE